MIEAKWKTSQILGYLIYDLADESRYKLHLIASRYARQMLFMTGNNKPDRCCTLVN